ncbi:MAG: HAMP domain-containing protein [Rhodobacteraceae bacterium]|nr:HAMP domain-containing protein [Paracoccaceae bacterium]
MLDRVTIAARVAGGFGVVIALLLALALTGIQSKRLLDANFDEYREGVARGANGAELRDSMRLAQFALADFSADPSAELGEALDAAAAHFAEAARLFVSESGRQGQGADTARIADAAQTFAAAAAGYRAAVQAAAATRDEVTRLGIAHRRGIGRINTALEERGARDLAYDALRASEMFLVTRVRIDRFLDGWPVEEFATADAPLAATLDALDRLSRAAVLPEERAALRAEAEGVMAFRSAAEAARDAELARRDSRAVVEGAAPPLVAAVEGAMQAAIDARARLGEEADRQIDATQLLTLVLSAVALLSALIIALAIARSVTRATSGLSASIDRLAEGTLDEPVPGAELHTEIGAMARALEVLRERGLESRRLAAEAEAASRAEDARQEQEAARQRRVVGDISAGLERLARGDLASPITSPAEDPFPPEYEAVRGAYNQVVQRLSGTMARIGEVAAAVRTSAGEIASASGELSGRAETQAATLEQSAAALNELTESVRSTAARAETAERASQENRAVAEQGTAIVREAVAAMAGIERSSAQITRIIGVIDDIAFQTNLLALNAGVEAARAGEAGRGFAVVASEVRGLAQRATESAREIKALIHESAAQVETGSSLVGRTGSSLEDILAKAGEVSSLMGDIAAAATEQAAGLDEINSGVNHLDQVTQQNAAVAEQTTAAAASLTAKAEELATALAGFRTGVGVAGGGVVAGAAAVPLDPQLATVLSWPGPAPAQESARTPSASPHFAPTGTDWSEF